MKRIIVLSIIAVAFLLPTNIVKSNTIATKAHYSGLKRIIDIFMEGYVLTATSDAKSGVLQRLELYNSAGQMVLSQPLSGYLQRVDISAFPSGEYDAYVVTAKGKYDEYVNI